MPDVDELLRGPVVDDGIFARVVRELTEQDERIVAATAQAEDTLSHRIDCLRAELYSLKEEVLSMFKDDWNAIICKLKECAREKELVDEHGGALDEFLDSFIRH